MNSVQNLVYQVERLYVFVRLPERAGLHTKNSDRVLLYACQVSTDA